jgi:Icc-related predicted phosphoesterase
VKILGLSDVEVPAVYSSRIRERFGDIDIVVSCGDLPAAYLEFAVSMLDIPLYFVQGNHVYSIENKAGTIQTHPDGAVNLHQKVYYDRKHDLIFAGIEGSLKYNKAAYQYSQRRMWWMILKMVPRFLINKILYGRYLDIFVTHAPATDLHDCNDYAHKGVDAFRWLIDTFKPRYHLHGHVHRYNPLSPRETQYKQTKVVNVYGYREINL